MIVLFVCTGNVCRSPMAERLARVMFPPDLGIKLRSAGTHALGGEPIHPFSGYALEQLGAETSSFAARQLTEQMVAESDLILTATREHRSHAVAMQPRAVRNAFTLLEFAALAQLIDGSSWALASLIDEVRMLRGTVPAPVGGFELADPFGGPRQTHEDLAVQLHQALAAIAQRLAGPSAQRGGPSSVSSVWVAR